MSNRLVFPAFAARRLGASTPTDQEHDRAKQLEVAMAHARHRPRGGGTIGSCRKACGTAPDAGAAGREDGRGAAALARARN